MLTLLVLVYANMLGIAFIIVVGLAITKPLATGEFVVVILNREHHVISLPPFFLRQLVYTILQRIWFQQQRVCLLARHPAIPIYTFRLR